MAATTTSLLRQLGAIFFEGNSAVIFTDHIALLPPGLSVAAHACIKVITPANLSDMTIHAALIEDIASGTWQVQLAAREGLLIQTIIVRHGHTIPLMQLMYERTLTVNTAAAGGNIPLIMANDQISV